MATLDEILDTLRTVIQLEQAMRGSYAGRATTVWNLASRRYTPMTEVHLDLIRKKGQVDWTRDGPHLFLPMTTKGKTLIPISGIRIDLRDAASPQLRFHVAFFAASDLVPNLEELHGLGFRFETPEGDGLGLHGFYHAQPFTHFVKNDAETRIQNCPEWIPVQQPAFPLDAGDPLGLLAMMLVSIYGSTDVSREYGSELVARIPKVGAAQPIS